MKTIDLLVFRLLDDDIALSRIMIIRHFIIYLMSYNQMMNLKNHQETANKAFRALSSKGILFPMIGSYKCCHDSSMMIDAGVL